MDKQYNKLCFFGKIMGLFAATSLLFPVSAAAQNVDNDTDIVVDGVRIKPEKHIPRLLDDSKGQLERFEGTFCPKVSGMPEKYAKEIEAKVKQNAIEFGLTVTEDCKANALIVFTPVINEFMTELRKKRFTWFGSLTPRNINLLKKADQPFYTWHDTLTLTLAGTEAIGAEALNGFGVGSASPNLGEFGNYTSDGSRISSNFKEVTANAFIVIDIFKTNNMSLQQLADFSTFHLLANIDENRTDLFLPSSILNLFNAQDPKTLTGFSDVDKLTIKGLYNSDSNAVSSWQKNIRIARYVRNNYEQ